MGRRHAAAGRVVQKHMCVVDERASTHRPVLMRASWSGIDDAHELTESQVRIRVCERVADVIRDNVARALEPTRCSVFVGVNRKAFSHKISAGFKICSHRRHSVRVAVMRLVEASIARVSQQAGVGNRGIIGDAREIKKVSVNRVVDGIDGKVWLESYGITNIHRGVGHQFIHRDTIAKVGDYLIREIGVSDVDNEWATGKKYTGRGRDGGEEAVCQRGEIRSVLCLARPNGPLYRDVVL